MSTEDTVKSLGAAFAFVGVAWLADLISAGLASLQISVFAALFAGPQALVTGAIALILTAVDFLFGTEILSHVAGGFAVFLSIQMLVALLTLCVFYVIVLISPKGSYTLSDCLIAAGVFLLEATPFLCTFVFWGTFATYLRRREVSKVASVLPQTRAISAIAKGTKLLGGGKDGKGGVAGGLLQKALKRT